MPVDDDFHYQPEPGRAAVDPAMRRIVLGAGGAAFLIIAIALAWGGFRAGGFGPPPEIAPPPGPLRVTPADPGGLTVPGANMPIMSGASAKEPAQLAAAPATPAVATLNQDAGLPPPPAPPPPPHTPPAAPPPPPPPQLRAPPLQQPTHATPSPVAEHAVELGGFAAPAAAQAFCTPLAAAGATCRVLP